MPPSDEEFDAWLRSLLKRLDLRWAAYRKKRKTVRKRMDSRARRIGLDSWREYARYLDDHPREWTHLSEVLAITVSRFFRDPPLFEHLARDVFPRIAEMGSGRLVAWSAGCASGQEAYTLAVLWEAFCSPRPGAPRLEILGTDVDAASLKRAGNAAFLKSEIEWVPASLRELHFHKEDDVYRLRPETASRARFFRHDLLRDPYPDKVHLLLCRWSAFFYFGDSLQMRVLSKFSESLVDGGFLVIGKHETLPGEWSQDFDPAEGRKDVFIRKPRGRPGFLTDSQGGRAASSIQGGPLEGQQARAHPEGATGSLSARA